MIGLLSVFAIRITGTFLVYAQLICQDGQVSLAKDPSAVGARGTAVVGDSPAVWATPHTDATAQPKNELVDSRITEIDKPDAGTDQASNEHVLPCHSREPGSLIKL